MTLDEPVEEYLETHHAEPVTVANLRWMLGKPRTALAETRPERSPKGVWVAADGSQQASLQSRLGRFGRC
jgi:hypothetical protein